jgi:hypothetical protein
LETSGMDKTFWSEKWKDNIKSDKHKGIHNLGLL